MKPVWQIINFKGVLSLSTVNQAPLRIEAWHNVLWYLYTFSHF